MANRFAGLDPTWAHLPTPAPTHAAHAAASHYYSSPAAAAAAFENEALTSALRASMAPAHAYSAAAAKASSFASPSTPSSSTSSASELMSCGHDAPAPVSRPAARSPTARAPAGPKGGRVTKRKPRPSRRAQTTYITADPANFRRMVQEITGLPTPGPSSSFPAASDAFAAAAAAPSWTPAPAPAFVLPTLDTSAFLLDPAAAAPAPEDYKRSSGSASAAAAAVAAAGNDDDSSALLQLELDAMIGFPTLESWEGFI